MSWIQKLYQTYENCQSMVGTEADENKVPLLPICHTTQKAHIEIAIDQNGSFKRARVVPKEEARTIIPCTESSAGRTSGSSPHPLCDKLQYIASDYSAYGGEKEPRFRISNSEYSKQDIENQCFEEECRNIRNEYIRRFLDEHKKLRALELLNKLISTPGLLALIANEEGMPEKYKANASNTAIVTNKNKLIEFFPNTLKKTVTYEYVLENWCNSVFAHPKAQAILRYVRKENVVGDLVDFGILQVGMERKLIKTWEKNKENNVPEIFKVLQAQEDAFVRWEVESPGELVTKVWNDRTLWESWIQYYSTTKTVKGLCYVTGDELYLADQHPSKLRNDGDKAKLISSNDTSGFTFRGRFLTSTQASDVGFAVTQKAHYALRWLISRQGYRRGDQAIVAWSTSGKSIPDPTADALSILGFDELPSDESDVVSTAQELAIKLRNKIAGYRAELGGVQQIVVMGLDSATPGRMAITFYRELSNSEFLKRLEQWHTTCSWLHRYGYDPDTKRHYQFVGAPAPGDIAEAAFGRRVDDKLRKTTVERILPCIVDDQQIPRDLVESTVRRASNRIGMDKWDWEKTLSIACALYRKFNQKETYDMALDPNRKTRDYLYGRLLAIADRLEGHALYKAKEKRDTNAARYMQQFAERPNKTWRQIELLLSPSIARLGGAGYYKSLIDEVMCKFDPVEDFNSDRPLTGEFLLGYHCQRAALWQKQDPDLSTQSENDEN